VLQADDHDDGADHGEGEIDEAPGQEEEDAEKVAGDDWKRVPGRSEAGGSGAGCSGEIEEQGFDRFAAGGQRVGSGQFGAGAVAWEEELGVEM